MRRIIISLCLLALFACKKEATPTENDTTSEAYSEGNTAETKTPEELGKFIFEGKGNCTSCHQIDKKVIGPSLQEIAKIYKEKNGDLIAFLQDKADPIVDPSQFEVMKANFEITKTLSNEELSGIEAYIYSHLK